MNTYGESPRRLALLDAAAIVFFLIAVTLAVFGPDFSKSWPFPALMAGFAILMVSAWAKGGSARRMSIIIRLFPPLGVAAAVVRYGSDLGYY